MYIATTTQMTIQLTIQPLKKNETYKIPTTPLPTFNTPKSDRTKQPFNTPLNTCKHPPSSPDHSFTCAAPSTLPHSAGLRQYCPKTAVNTLISRLLPYSGTFYHAYKKSGHTAGINQPCSRSILKPIKRGLNRD